MAIRLRIRDAGAGIAGLFASINCLEADFQPELHLPRPMGDMLVSIPKVGSPTP